MAMHFFDNRQTATLLAALRYWQREGIQSAGPERDIATDGDTLTALTPHEIDDLCGELNFNGRRFNANLQINLQNVQPDDARRRRSRRS